MRILSHSGQRSGAVINKLYLIGPDFISTFTRSICLYASELDISLESGMEYNGETLTLQSKVLTVLNPFNKRPILIDGDTVIYESIAIMIYLDQKAQKIERSLLPNEPLKMAEIMQWSLVLMSEVDKILIRKYLLEFTFPRGDNGSARLDKIEAIEPKVIEYLEIISQQLGEKEFLCGEGYSMVDALLTPMLDYLSQLLNRKQLFENSTTLLDYTEKMRRRKSGVILAFPK